MSTGLAEQKYFLHSGAQARWIRAGILSSSGFEPIELVPSVYPDNLPAGLLTETDRQVTPEDIEWAREYSNDGYILDGASVEEQRKFVAEIKASERLGLRGVDRLSRNVEASLFAAQLVHQAGVIETPLVNGDSLLPDRSQSALKLKLENQQVTGAYKARGAAYFMSQLSDEERTRGVAAVTSGNHGAAVPWAAQRFGADATVFMPANAAQVKQDKAREQGAKVELVDGDFARASAALAQFVADTGAVAVPPFEHTWTMLGQSTIGVELAAQDRAMTHVLVPVGGGGLISGVGRYLKQVRPDVKIIGVEPVGQDAMTQSLTSGRRAELPEVDGWVDGTAVRQVGQLTLDCAQRYVDDVLVVPKSEVARAMIDLHEFGQTAEPAGALALAGVRHMVQQRQEQGNFVAICSGGNVDQAKLAEAYRLSRS